VYCLCLLLNPPSLFLLQRGAVWYAAELRNTSSLHAPWWAALPPRQPLLVTTYTFPEEYQHLLSSPDWVS
jgi:hypothetical protein